MLGRVTSCRPTPCCWGVAFRVDQSTLTGESVPVDKAGTADPGPVGSTPTPPAGAADTEGRLSSGTVVVHGRGLARVAATGPDSTLGHIAGMLQSPPRATPLRCSTG